MSTAQNRRREPDLAKLRDLPRAEAIRIAMIMYGWDAETAAEKVESEQGRYTKGEDRRQDQGVV